MPQTFGEFTDPEKKRLAEWAEKHHIHDVECPVCDSTSWEFTNHFFKGSVASSVSGMLNPVAYPSFGAVCTNCGYMMQFNAVLTEIMDQPEGSTTKAPDNIEGSAK